MEGWWVGHALVMGRHCVRSQERTGEHPEVEMYGMDLEDRELESDVHAGK